MTRGSKTYLMCAALVFVIPGMRTLRGAEIKELPATFMEKVTPGEARVNDLVTVEGLTLDADHVKAVFLTNREAQVEVEIVAQGTNHLRFKVPAIAPGKWHIAIRVVPGDKFLEEPVFLFVLPSKG